MIYLSYTVLMHTQNCSKKNRNMMFFTTWPVSIVKQEN